MRGRKNRLFSPSPSLPLSPLSLRVPSRCIVAKSWQQGKEKCIDSSPGGRRLWCGWVLSVHANCSAAEEHEQMRKSLRCCMSVPSISTFTVQRSWSTMVASSLSREMAEPLRKSVSRTRRTLPHEASLQERSWQEHRALCQCQTDRLALDGAILWMMKFGWDASCLPPRSSISPSLSAPLFSWRCTTA